MAASDLLRYLIEYLPAEMVADITQKHAKAISRGGSVWDYVQLEHLTQQCDCANKATALALAQGLVALDEYQDIHVFEQEAHQQRDEHGSWLRWDIRRRAVFHAGDAGFAWRT